MAKPKFRGIIKYSEIKAPRIEVYTTSYTSSSLRFEQIDKNVWKKIGEEVQKEI